MYKRPEVVVPEDWRDKATITVPQAGQIVGVVNAGAAYRAARKGDIPTINIGGRIFVPVIPLRRLLGEQVDPPANGQHALNGSPEAAAAS